MSSYAQSIFIYAYHIHEQSEKIESLMIFKVFFVF